jgi:GNAT superfamily N-acetyltransferase
MPAPVATVHPRKARAGDIGDLSRLLAASFRADPVLSWCCPVPARRAEILPRAFAISIAADLGHGEVYTTGDGMAGAVCLPPGAEVDEAPLVPAYEAVMGDDAPRFFELFERMAAAHPREPHYYVNLMATHPGHQSRGIGSALLAHLLEQGERHGAPAYLEATSERSVPLYARHGFDVVGEIRLPGGPSLWPMWRA